MSEQLEKDFKNINDNFSFGVRSLGLFGRTVDFLCRIFFRRQIELNASFVRILNRMRMEFDKQRMEFDKQRMEFDKQRMEFDKQRMEFDKQRMEFDGFLKWRVYIDKNAAVHPGGPGFDYYGFEKVFRPAGVVAERLTRYVEFFSEKNCVIDVGCGRGEFLALLREKGIRSAGVDGNADMVNACRAKGLEAFNSDFKEYLSSLQDGSVEGVFSAQFIEHIQFNELDRFIKLSFKKLKPGGVFLAETINPYHPVGFRTFYVDPTHVKPLFPEVLEFLCRSAGFQKVKTVFVPPSGAIEQGLEEPWNFTDFAVVAEKAINRG